MTPTRPPRHRAAAAVFSVALATFASIALAGPANGTSPTGGGISPAPAPARATFTNPVSEPAADTFADPSLIRGRDGRWYAYATSDPLKAGDPTVPLLPVLSSTDLVTWTSAGSVFAVRPSWATPTAGIWAPDIRWVDGRYVLYYVVTDTTALPGDTDSAIGVATAPTPLGPWTDSGGPLVAPRPGNGSYLGTIDPAGFTDTEGHRWLYWASFNGGGFVTRLTDDGLHTVGEPTRVLVDNRYEGSYVVRHGGYYYMFASATNCCAGPVTGYTVFAGRSTEPTGPFVDRDGASLNVSRVGGTQVIAPYGNEWIGTGHNAVIEDESGQSWFFYHAIPRSNPYLTEPYGVNRRPMLIDRLDWIDGWPTVRGGRGASDTPQAAPVTTGPVDEPFTAAPAAGTFTRVAGTFTLAGSAAGKPGDGYLRQTAAGPALVVSQATVPSGVRVEADVRLAAGTARGAAGVAVRYASPTDHVAVGIDRAARTLAVDVVTGGRHAVTTQPLPDSFDVASWHTLAVDVRGRQLTASVSDSRLADPQAVLTRTLPASANGTGTGNRVALVADGPADFDAVSAAALARPAGAPAPGPRPGAALPAYSTEFAGSGVPAGWSWVRRDPAATVAGGQLVWPVQAGDLNNTPANAGILLRTAPAGDYVVETKVTLPLGVDDVRNFQQAGIAAYAGDDDIARLATVAIWNTRQIEFNRKLVYAGRVTSSGTVLGRSAPTVWLRLYSHVDPVSGERLFRAASSVDGAAWELGGTWTFAPGVTPRIGLVSLGGAEPAATSRFDYVRFSRLASGSAGFPR